MNKVTEFVFNELEFFTDLMKKENVEEEEKKEILNSLELENVNYKFVYLKDNAGSWFIHCYKGNERINWNDVALWIKPYVWDFEKENNLKFN